MNDLLIWTCSVDVVKWFFLGCENCKHLVARWVNRKLLDDSSLCNYSVENTRIMLVPTFPRLAHKIYLTTKATEVGQQCGKD